jgi:hypothetical protein
MNVAHRMPSHQEFTAIASTHKEKANLNASEQGH